MKKVFNFVTKRKNSSNQDVSKKSQDGVNHDGSSLGRNSIGSSASSSVLQFAQTRFNPDPGSHGSPSSQVQSSTALTKYNIDTKFGKDKSLSKLHVAVFKEDLEKVKKLVRNEQQEIEASLNNNSKAFKFAKKEKELLVNSRDRFNRTPIHLCASIGHVEILWQLLSHGADVHVKDSDGATPLHRAVDAGHNEVARLILDRGCSLDVADIEGDCVLHLAARKENNEILAALLRKGANPDLKNAKSEAPLHETIRLGQVASSQLLLRSGASVNLPGPQEMTPLMLASSKSGMEPLVDTLLNYEGDPCQKDIRGWTALDYAKNQNLAEVIRMLEEFISDSQHRLAIDDPDYHSFDEEEDANWNAQENTGIYQDNMDNQDDEDNGYSLPVGALPLDTEVQQPIEGVPVSDLSSWGSSGDEESLGPAKPSFFGGVKKSAGMMDLSKFLTPSDDEEEERVVAIARSHQSPEEVAKNERIYDSVENLVDNHDALDLGADIVTKDHQVLDSEFSEDDCDDDANSDWDTPRLPGDELHQSHSNKSEDSISPKHETPEKVDKDLRQMQKKSETKLTFKEELELKLQKTAKPTSPQKPVRNISKSSLGSTHNFIMDENHLQIEVETELKNKFQSQQSRDHSICSDHDEDDETDAFLHSDFAQNDSTNAKVPNMATDQVLRSKQTIEGSPLSLVSDSDFTNQTAKQSEVGRKQNLSPESTNKNLTQEFQTTFTSDTVQKSLNVVNETKSQSQGNVPIVSPQKRTSILPQVSSPQRKNTELAILMLKDELEQKLKSKSNSSQKNSLSSTSSGQKLTPEKRHFYFKDSIFSKKEQRSKSLEMNMEGQPISLPSNNQEEKPASKRRGSRTSRSLRSSHFSALTRSLAAPIHINGSGSSTSPSTTNATPIKPTRKKGISQSPTQSSETKGVPQEPVNKQSIKQAPPIAARESLQTKIIRKNSFDDSDSSPAVSPIKSVNSNSNIKTIANIEKSPVTGITTRPVGPIKLGEVVSVAQKTDRKASDNLMSPPSVEKQTLTSSQVPFSAKPANIASTQRLAPMPPKTQSKSQSKKSSVPAPSSAKNATEANVKAIKEEFLSKLKEQNDTASNQQETAKLKKQIIFERSISSKTSSRSNSVSSSGMLDSKILEMERPDLLVQLQKLQIILDQEKELRTKAEEELQILRSEAQNNVTAKDEMSKLETDAKEMSKQLRQITAKLEEAEKANKTLTEALKEKDLELGDLEEYVDVKKSELSRIKEDLDVQCDKRQRMETLFQDVSEREMQLQRKTQIVSEENIKLKNENDRLLQIETEISDQIQELQEEMQILKEENLQLKENQRNEDELQSEKNRVSELQLKMEEISNLLNLKEKENEKSKHELNSVNQANHKLIVESEVLKRELAEIRESLSRDKHVSISVGEKHKRELEGVIKELEQVKRENKRIREESKLKDTKREGAEKELLNIKQAHQIIEDELVNATKEVEHTKLELSRVRGEHDRRLEDLKVAKERSDKEKFEVQEEMSLMKMDLENSKVIMEQKSKEANCLRSDLDQLNQNKIRIEEREKVSQERIALLESRIKEMELSKNEAKFEPKVDNGFVVDICAEDPNLSEVTHELSILKFELTKLQSILQEKERELTEVKVRSANVAVAVNLENSKQVDELKSALSRTESRLHGIQLELEVERRKANTYDNHIKYLKERVATLESQLERVAEEKKMILNKLKSDEDESDVLKNEIIQELKMQIGKEQRKLQQSNEKVIELEDEKVRLEIDLERLEKEFKEVKDQLQLSRDEKRKLSKEVSDKASRLSVLEIQVEDERRRSQHLSETVNDLESDLMDERTKVRLAEERVAILKASNEREDMQRAKIDQRRAEKQSSLNPILLQMEQQIQTLKQENSNSEMKLKEANEKIRFLHSELKKAQKAAKEIPKKDNLIEELEVQVSEMRAREVLQQKKDLKKIRLTYEILARNELNAKLSEINSFLEDRAAEQAANDKKNELLMDHIQKDMGDRLQKSKEELNEIKLQMQETERGITQLQLQLETRERELNTERTIRKKLERQFEKQAEKKILNQLNKPYAYF